MTIHEATDIAVVPAHRERIVRHALPERLFHWVTAGSVLTLLVTSLGPVAGWPIDWVPVHWIAGVVLTVAILFHVVRALLRLDIWSITPDRNDIENGWRAVMLTLGRGGHAPGRPGKYPMMQKLFHWGIAGWIGVLIVTGGLMLAKIDTPFWQRNPYFLSEFWWGIVYTIHGVFALGMVTLIVMHVYFALRPDKLYLLRSMILGWMTRDEYLTDHDPRRWAAAPIDEGRGS
ncbi:MAG TPA: cytochrome b/b6 domain-containing protein [Hyphomicrobiales bacterium]|nr:cytochrome b/b6 domain-containing protein [Hyphomicrobiales bacterium]